MLPQAIFSINDGGMLRLHLNQRPQIFSEHGTGYMIALIGMKKLEGKS